MALKWHTNPAPHRRLNRPERGEDVKRLQKAMNNRAKERGWSDRTKVDGIFGPDSLTLYRKCAYWLGLPARSVKDTHPPTIAAQGIIRWPWTRTPTMRARTGERLRAKKARTVPASHGGWHPDAIRTQTKSPLSFIGVKPKLVWHTTEGTSLPIYSGSAPHFTLDFKRGRLYQHVPITGGAYALANRSGGVETNRANAIQVELIGFARDSQNWSNEDYEEIADLARWIEKHAGVPRQCSVTFRQSASYKVSDWYGYAGHIGHQHVPENDHWDPGLLRIEKVI